MANAPTYFDHLNLRDELRGVEGVGERRAVISRHVLAAFRHFHHNIAGFDFDYDTPRVRELWAGVEEAAEDVERCEKTEAHLSGALSAWQVTVCEEYLERGRAERAAADAAVSAPAERPPAAERNEVAASEEANDDGEQTPAKTKRRPASRPARTPPAPPAPSPQGSLFG